MSSALRRPVASEYPLIGRRALRTLTLTISFVIAFPGRTHELVIVRPGDRAAMQKMCAAYFQWEKLTHDRVHGLYDRCAYGGTGP